LLTFWHFRLFSTTALVSVCEEGVLGTSLEGFSFRAGPKKTGQISSAVSFLGLWHGGCVSKRITEAEGADLAG
jgi:hypothetical protein